MKIENIDFRPLIGLFAGITALSIFGIVYTAIKSPGLTAIRELLIAGVMAYPIWKVYNMDRNQILDNVRENRRLILTAVGITTVYNIALKLLDISLLSFLRQSLASSFFRPYLVFRSELGVAAGDFIYFFSIMFVELFMIYVIVSAFIGDKNG